MDAGNFVVDQVATLFRCPVHTYISDRLTHALAPLKGPQE